MSADDSQEARFAIIREEWLNYLAATGKSTSTIREYTRISAAFAERLSRAGIAFDAVGQKELAAWLAVLRASGVTRVTMKTYLAIISSYYRWMNRAGYVKLNPATLIEPIRREKKIPDHLSEAEVDQLILAAPAPRGKAALEILYATGCRASEVVGLTLKDFDLESGVIKVFGKGSKSREAPLTKPAVQAIRAWLPIREKIARNTDALFVNRFGGKLHYGAILRELKKIARKAGITRRVSVHMLRHSISCHLINRGVGIEVLQALLGHERIETTAHYGRILSARAASIIRQAHPREMPGGTR